MTTMQVQDLAGLTPGSPEWLAVRRNGLGASEVPAILGLDTYKSGLDIWLDKRGMADPHTESPQARVGRFAERMIADMYQDAMGVALVAVPSMQSPALPYLFASADRMVRDEYGYDVRLLEIKNRGGIPQGWGDAGTDQIPMSVAVQVHVQMHSYNMTRCDVAALLGGNDFRVYTLWREPEIEATLLEQIETWWTRHMVDGIEPPMTGPNVGAYLARKFKQSTDEVVAATPEANSLLVNLADVRAQMAALETTEGDLVNQIKNLIGANAGLMGPAGKATWKVTKGTTSTDWKALVASLDVAADVIAQYTTTKDGSRRFLFTPAKER